MASIAGVVVEVLGDVRVSGARGPVPALRRRSLELVTLLALRPGLSEVAVSEALWPEEMPGPRQRQRRNEYMRVARRWLGDDPVTGRPHVALVAGAGGYRLEGVGCDLEMWRAQVGDPHATQLEVLLAALAGVRGRPLSGLDVGMWEWAQAIKSAVCLEVAQVAWTTCVRAAEAGEWTGARLAAETGVMCDPSSPRLWRAAVRTADRCEGPAAADQVRRRARAALATVA